MWPGNTADVTTLIPVIDRLRGRFAIARVCVVADRGMISAETMAELEARRLLYILGVRERTDKLVRELVLGDAASFIPLVINKRGRQTDYEAKAVMLAGHVTSSVAIVRRPRRTPPIALQSSPRWRASSHFKGRSWQGLHRHALMTMITYAFPQYRPLKTARRGKKNPRPAASTDISRNSPTHR
jgi:hypothetical protein